MSQFRKTIEIQTVNDPVIGGTKTLYWRALQPVNKDGRDSKRPARRTGAYLVVYADGGYRYYGPRGYGISLARERITEGYRQVEMDAPTDEELYDWND